jgi:uncharacterized protein YndB with AHSA1/START domain
MSDRLEKNILLRASRARVWRAISDSREFGDWFRMRLESPFSEGATVRGKITAPGFEDLAVEMKIERIDPEKYFAYRWHPYAIDPKIDYSSEPTTLVEFRLEEAAGGTHLTIVESGFDQIPLARRAEAFRMNDGGWTEQLTNIERHVASQ